MNIALALFALAVTIGAGYLLVKGHKPVIILLLAGFILIAVSTAAKAGYGVLDEEDSTGSRWLDIIGIFEQVAGSQLTGVGLIIMAAGGFSAYMNKIGASQALVEVLAAPIAKFKHPYITLILTYFLGVVLFMFIPSAAGLAILLLVLLLPVLKAVGVSPAAAGAVIVSASALPMGPASGTSVLSARTIDLSPVVYFVQYQLIVAIPTAIAIAITHYFVQQHYDKRDLEDYKETDTMGDGSGEAGPKWYGLFLALPIILLIIFSPLVNDSIELSTVGPDPQMVDTLKPASRWELRYLSTMPRKTYTEQFKRDAVSLYESTPGATLNAIASDLGVNRNSLRTWLDAFGTGTKTNANGEKVASPIAAANSARTPAEGLSDAERIRVLERENAKLREEREILRKAAKYFAEETNW